MLDFLQRAFYVLFRPEFTVRVEGAVARLIDGKLSQRFLDELTSVAELQGIDRCMIYGVRQRGRVRLVFSTQVKAGDQQRFRNAFYSP